MMAFYVLYILNDKYLCFDFPSNGDVLLGTRKVSSYSKPT